MRDAAFWKDRWLEVPTHVDLADQNEKREKTGFVSVLAWPLVLLILQAGIFAPLYGSGFLNSPFEGDGVLVGPPSDAPLEPALPLNPPAEPDATPAPTPTATTPAAKEPTSTTTPAPTATRTATPSRTATPTPTTTDNPGTPGTDGTPGTPGTDGTTTTVVTPGPTTEIPEELGLDLDKGGSASFVVNTANMYPGQTRVVALRATNTGNVPLGTMTIRSTTDNALLRDASQGISVTTWACDTPWSGTVLKPVCSGNMLNGGTFSLASGNGNVGASAGNPGKSTYILTAMKLPSAADNRYQGINGNVTFTVSAQQTGGVVR